MQPSPAAKLFEKDFIILSEFSEQVGPVPVQYIPDESSKGNFDTSHFSVRIMTSDYQSQLGKLVGEDTQVLLSEKQNQVYAYVHYFSLNDIHARGFVRQYCFSYVTSNFYKLVDNFELLKQQFCEVTSMLKSGNCRVFRKDLEHHLADLNHTMAELEREGWMNMDIDSSKLYQGFDFAMEDVPERDSQQVENAIKETSEILDQLKEKMRTQERVVRSEETAKVAQGPSPSPGTKRQPPTGSPAIKRAREMSLGSPDSGNVDLTPASFTDSISSELTNSTSSDYQPQRVMTHTVHKFERRLRPLDELSYKAFSIAINKLKDMHKFFSRSEMALEMEKDEALLLDPRSSLLSIGRVPMINVLQNFNHFLSNQPSHLLEPRAYRISSRNTWGQPSDFSEGEVVVNGEAAGAGSGFDTSFVEERSCLNKYPLYIDFSSRSFSYNFSSVTTDFESSLNQSTLTDTLVRDGDSPNEPRLFGLSDDKQRSTELTVHQDEDQLSRGSPAYHTPEGLTPSPSYDGESTKGGALSDQETIKEVTSIIGQMQDSARSADSESNLDGGSRVPSQHSLASANSLSIQGDLLSGKTVPSITTSEVTAQPEISRSSRRSTSFSPPTSDISTSSEGGSLFVESWNQPLLPGKQSGKKPVKHARQLDDLAQVEETQSAGSGQFESSPAHPPSGPELAVEEKPSDSVVGYSSMAGKAKRPQGLPRQVSLMSGQISPEKYYSPMGEPPDVFDRLLSPSRQQSIVSQMSTINPYRGPSLVELRGKGKLPLISSVDLVECDLRFKPGRGIFNLWKDNPSVKDIFYCLLTGRPLAIIGRPTDERDIRRLVRLLWVFIPGHSSKQQIVTWQEKPLDMKDLSRVKLIGLSSKAVSFMSNSLKRHISLLDISTGKVLTPSYTGDLLRPIISRTRDRKNEQAFMAHLLSVLLDVSMKAYIYYHVYCASSKPPRQTAAGETSAKVYHSVLQRDSPQRQRSLYLNSLSIKGSDVDIIEYLVDLIREQQLAEWRNGPAAGAPSNEEPVTFKLYTKHCKESTHKSKRPY